MKYRSLGSSGEAVSEICIGTLNITPSNSEDSSQRELFDMAIESGVNLIDTSANYYSGEAEKFVSRVLKAHKNKNILVATKCFFPIEGQPQIGGLGNSSILASIEFSLRNLQISTVDIFQCHRWDLSVPIEETALTMTKLREQGKIRFWGLGNASAAQLVETVVKCNKSGLDAPVSHQHVYNMFNRTIEADILDTSHWLQIGTLAYSPLAQGVLSGKYHLEKIPLNSRANDPVRRQKMWEFSEIKLQKATRLAILAAEFGYSPAELALAWCLRTQTTSLICGINSSDQWIQNVNASNLKLDEEIINKIELILNNKPKNQYLN